jgi:uncharacterized membrane protein YfcA
MSKLQQSAWYNLAGSITCTAIGGLCFAALTRTNAKGLDYILIFLVVMCLATPPIYILWRRKGIEARFDEREKMIYARAFTISALILVAFLAGMCIIPFFLFGGQNVIHVYYLPVIFWATLFVAQFAHSTAILIYCELEDENERQ